MARTSSHQGGRRQQALALLLLPLLAGVAAAGTQVSLNIPSRLQWDNYGGYCGETSLQMSALYNGAWVSQLAWRAAGGGTQKKGQLLLAADPDATTLGGDGRGLVPAAEAMNMELEVFETVEDGMNQSADLLEWAEEQLTLGRPVILGVYVADCDPCNSEYDHIIPAVGFRSAAPRGDTAYRAADVLLTNSLYATQRTQRSFESLPGDSLLDGATPCDYDTLGGGCLPTGANYGVAVKGIRDTGRTSLPVRLAVDRPDEPNASLGEKAVPLRGTVTVSGLTKGRKYRLLRYNSAAAVPTSGDAKAFLASKYSKSTSFTATGSTWTWKDPTTILSSGVAYYRCVLVL